MKKLAELRQERAAKVEAQTQLLNEVRAAKGDFNEEEATRFDAFTTEIEALDTQIERAVKIDAAEKRQAALNGTPVTTGKSDGEANEARKIKEAASVTRALRLATTGKSLDGAEKEMNEVAIQESRDAQVTVPDNTLVNIPMSMLRATAQTVTEDSGNYGGNLVQDQAPRVQMPFAAKSFLEKLGAQRLSGLSGGDLPLPVMGNYAFQWLAETEAITRQKQQVTQAVLSPNRVGGAVSISNRLLAQSSVNVEAQIRSLLFGGYDRALNTAAINGSGASNQPTGILNTAGVQQSAIATVATKPTRDLVLELVALLDAADVSEDALGYLMHPQLRYLLQTTKVDAGSGRFVMEAKENLQGYTAAISTLVPELAGNKVMVFGDWSKLFIGEWGSLSVTSNPYSEDLENSVRVTANAHAGVAIAQPSAFAVNKFLNETGA